jgi:hypothetical protein
VFSLCFLFCKTFSFWCKFTVAIICYICLNSFQICKIKGFSFIYHIAPNHSLALLPSYVPIEAFLLQVFIGFPFTCLFEKIITLCYF